MLIFNTQMSDTKDFITQETINSVNINIFLSGSFDPKSKDNDMNGSGLVLKSSEGGVTRENL